MNDQCKVVVFEVRQDADGLYTATSPHLAGVFVAHRDLNKIVEDMPNIVQLWFKSHQNLDVEVATMPPRSYEGGTSYPIVPVPAEIAAQALAR